MTGKAAAAAAPTAGAYTPAAEAATAPAAAHAHTPDAAAAAEAQRQSLELLEWPAVCRQVAAFCGTSMAAELLLAGQLPIGSSRQHSELLLQQTQEAADAQLEVAGVFDLRPALAAAAGGGVLNPRQLEGVAASMEAAFELHQIVCVSAAAAAAAADADAGQHSEHRQQLQDAQQHASRQRKQQQQQQQQQRQYKWPCLADLAAGIQQRELATLRAIRSCISDGAVLSEASPELAAVRAARQANREESRSIVTGIARQLYTQGAAEGREPLLMRGRYCVAVRSSQRAAVGKGAVRLGASQTGATLYMEPPQVLELNNREALLAEQQEQQELAVLAGLSQLLVARGAALQELLGAVTALDIVAARAKHASWLGAVRPAFTSSSGSSSSSSSPMHMPGARHPLLMQGALPPLPRPVSIDDASFEADFVPPPLWASAAGSSGSSSSSDDDEADAGLNGSDGVQSSRPMPKPLDLRVPGDVRVVAITGPNTGGKTVTLKTAGLMALMAKAGLFVPVDLQELAAAAAAGSSSSSSNKSQPQLLWFDQVLADIGDAQSLQQNLSTFSGHIARLKLLLAGAGAGSLVLLDEVGSGTDPQEGAALARAVLDRLAGTARLTLATSHHAELKAAADEDSRYVNVSMEFNTVTLRPTYKLQWRCAGSSNALDIAQALGFDARVLAAARIIARAELGQREEKQGRMEQVAASVEGQLAEARAKVAAMEAARQQQEAEADSIRDKIRSLVIRRNKLRGLEKAVLKEQAELVLEVQQAAKLVRRQQAELSDVQAIINHYTAKVQSPASKASSAAAAAAGSASAASASTAAASTAAAAAAATGDEDVFDDLRVGEYVWVPSFAEAGQLMLVQVLKVSADHVFVDVPFMFMPVGHGSMKRQQGVKVPRSKVFSREQLQLPERALEGLAGYDAAQAEEDQQLLSSVDSMLQSGAAGSSSSSSAVAEGQLQQQQQGAAADGSSSAGAGSNRRKQQQAAQTYASVEQQQSNTLDLEGMVPEAAVDELADAIIAHQTAAAAAAAAAEDVGQLGLQHAGGSGLLDGGVLYVQHGVGTGAVKRAVLRCIEGQHAKGLVRRWKKGPDAGCTVVWLALECEDAAVC
uniref:DNA mismatch repair proteins mutS family domain-containing protein n=1 Tax=Tetradesmus obliquus TaxID=3088 RepID=A0A383W1M4_TETOB|eukprot:jgi/Sobl393_1/18058/SZX71013.1